MKNLMPLTVINNDTILNKDCILLVRYLQGSPRQYRFNASQGVLNLNGQLVLTQPKQPFSFTPVAFRYFEDELFGREERAYIEFFFINEALQLCTVMFHGYSAIQFKQHFSDYLFYDDLTPCEVVLTVTPVQKKNEKENATYFIAEFSSVKATPETIEAIRVLVEMSEPIYRGETLKSSEKHLSSMNYKLPETAHGREMRMIEQDLKDAALLAEFEPVKKLKVAA